MKEMLTQLEVDVGELGALMQLAGVSAVCHRCPVGLRTPIPTEPAHTLTLRHSSWCIGSTCLQLMA